MDNTVLPYSTNTDSSDESDSSDSSEEGNLLTNNLGVYNNKYEFKDERFMNMEKIEDHQKHRNDLFTPKIQKLRIVIESKTIDHSSTHDTSNYTIDFDNEESKNLNGYSCYNNVIGFKLIKAIIPHSVYQINKNNYSFLIQEQGFDPHKIELDQGSYTFTEIGNHLNSKLQAYDSNFSVDIPNTTTYKYKINHSSTNFRFLWNTSDGYAYRLLGFPNIDDDDSSYKLSHESSNVTQQTTHFVDLVVPEIPHIACKKNNTGKNLIERIPLGSSGSITEYTNDYNVNNYFYPLNLPKLSIQIYEDSTDLFYDSQNNDNSFEFEITMINH